MYLLYFNIVIDTLGRHIQYVSEVYFASVFVFYKLVQDDTHRLHSLQV